MNKNQSVNFYKTQSNFDFVIYIILGKSLVPKQTYEMETFERNVTQNRSSPIGFKP